MTASPPTAAPRALRDCLAPAKLNLFLHITGRRADGYHALQTVFQLLDWGDTLHFTRRDDGQVTRVNAVAGVPAEQDLTVRAARLLQTHTGCRLGVEIEIEKRIPMGGGLGGGSSDAATTLLALNRLWQLDIPRAQLQTLALQLGADVPVFVFGQNAFAEGVGEALQAVELPERHFLIVTPACHVPTAEIFSAQELTRDSEVVRIMDFLGQQNADSVWPLKFGRNDMQAVVVKKYQEVAQVLDWFEKVDKMAPARMTGSGASVFAAFESRAVAVSAQARLQSDGLLAGPSDSLNKWKSVVASGILRHPLFAFVA
jgi:4-diphosphocytidyl-2-C-methyl-D-erythritol kinase